MRRQQKHFCTEMTYCSSPGAETNKVSVAGEYGLFGFTRRKNGGKRGLKGTNSKGGRMFILLLLWFDFGLPYHTHANITSMPRF